VSIRVDIALLLVALLPSAARADADRSRLPNVVLIVADDLGYGDLGCFGSNDIATPRLDGMAREGIRFTDYSAAAPFCSPSRAALLTGRLPARCGVPYVLFPAERHGLPADEITLAELLRERGYATACVGKWHLGWTAASRPLANGFDEFFGLPYSNDSTEWPLGERFTQVMGPQPLPLIDGDRIIEAPVDQSTLTRRYTERAARFIRENRDRPFFLYLAHTMPHVPQYASPQFKGK
jgi:arylsulfatase A